VDNKALATLATVMFLGLMMMTIIASKNTDNELHGPIYVPMAIQNTQGLN
jgi:hypothetical protein